MLPPPDSTDVEESNPLAGLDFGGETINILFPESHGGAADQIDWVEEDDGEIISSALYARQSTVEELLNINLTVHKDYKVSSWVDTFKSSVLADDKSFDIVYGPQANTAPLVLENMYVDLSSAKYIDYSKPYWNNTFMDESSIGGKRYLLAGDISLSMLSYMSCTKGMPAFVVGDEKTVTFAEKL